jgi:hypothetical protein
MRRRPHAVGCGGRPRQYRLFAPSAAARRQNRAPPARKLLASCSLALSATGTNTNAHPVRVPRETVMSSPSAPALSRPPCALASSPRPVEPPPSSPSAAATARGCRRRSAPASSCGAGVLAHRRACCRRPRPCKCFRGAIMAAIDGEIAMRKAAMSKESELQSSDADMERDPRTSLAMLEDTSGELDLLFCAIRVVNDSQMSLMRREMKETPRRRTTTRARGTMIARARRIRPASTQTRTSNTVLNIIS